MDEVILETKDLGFSYLDGTKALDSINMQIQKGKTIGVLGGNGAGKTTLFLQLNGIYQPSQGQVFYKGKPITYKKQVLSKLKQSVGIVFQNPDHQLFSASVYEDVSFGVMNLGLSKEEVRSRVEKALIQTGMKDFSHKPTHSLSYGQKKRVALAGVLAMEPEVLILDEPTAGLDPRGVSEMMHLIRQIQSHSQLAVILSTHDIDLVPLYCDYVYVLNEGQIVEEGSPEHIFERPDRLRKVHLRTTRIAHLMEILKEKDGLPIPYLTTTIKGARAIIKHIYFKDKKEYVVKDKKILRYGYTTGSCVAAAAKASAEILFSKQEITQVSLMTPKGVVLQIPITVCECAEDHVTCSVVKQAGDDPDVTDGMILYATVSKATHNSITVEGGCGIGRVTKSGLKVPVGEAAINPVPRQMILDEVRKVGELWGYEDGLDILIEAPEGVDRAKKTFNERLGIIGGISILGTSGIVEPMSEKAIIDTIYTQMDVIKANGKKNLVICPGNYGTDFTTLHLNISESSIVKCSNFIGETLDYAVYLGFERILMIGHVGKFIKLAAGIMNTHSRYADGRMEIMYTHAARIGASQKTLAALWQSITTDEALGILKEEGILEQVMASIMEKIRTHVDYRVSKQIPVQVVLFSSVYGLVGSLEDRQWITQQVKEDFENEG